jgi:predicted RNase H-like HicB family nuclease
MNFPVVIHKDKDSDYGVTVPDLPGCFTAGGTLDEAIAMAQEAIELHLEGLIKEGQAIARPGTVEDYKHNPDYKGGTWAVVSISPSNLRTKARRINISIPKRVLDAVDRFAMAENETRSGLLAKAATAYIRNRPAPAKKRRPQRAK